MSERLLVKSHAFIDWISYTKMNSPPLLEYPMTPAGCARDVFWQFMKWIDAGELIESRITPVKPNKPFRDAFKDEYTKARIEYGGGSDRVLVSFPGTACEVLRRKGITQDILKNVCSDVSRIDLTLDILTDTTPMEFCKLRDKERHKNGAVMYSDEGITQYVGSWSSDRFARVYRYNPPHVRSAFLRVEHVFRGNQGKSIAAKLVSSSPRTILETVGAIYGWTHNDFFLAVMDAGQQETVAWHKTEVAEGKTLRWLQEVCCPSIIKLVREGEIVDVRAWFEVNVCAKLETSTSDRSPGESSFKE
jgi:hypothetical protein